MTGLLPMCAVATSTRSRIGEQLPEFAARVTNVPALHPEYARAMPDRDADDPVTMLALVGRDRLPRVLERLADEGEFLSRHGLRSLSAAYRDQPFELWQDGHVIATVDYEPAESTTSLFGGNSNWRGPIWFPVNYLVIAALRPLRASATATSLTVEYPHGSGRAAHARLDRRATCAGGWCRSSCPASDGVGGRCSPGAPAPDRAGPTRCCSTSTSTATTAAASAPRTRPGGPGWWPTS